MGQQHHEPVGGPAVAVARPVCQHPPHDTQGTLAPLVVPHEAATAAALPAVGGWRGDGVGGGACGAGGADAADQRAAAVGARVGVRVRVRVRVGVRVRVRVSERAVAAGFDATARRVAAATPAVPVRMVGARDSLLRGCLRRLAVHRGGRHRPAGVLAQAEDHRRAAAWLAAAAHVRVEA